MADNNTLPEPKLRTEKYLNAIANNTAGGGGETAIIKKSKTITANGTYSALNEDFDGYEQVIANVPNSFTPADEGKVVDNGHLVAQTSTSALQNGTINTTTNNEVVVNVPNTYVAADEGKVVSNGGLVSQTSTNINTNGTVNTTTNNEVVVAVPNTYTAGDEGKVVSNGALVGQTSTNILSNGTVDTTLNNEVVVAVPNTYAAGDEGKVVSNGALVAQTAYPSTVTVNDTYDTTNYNSITVDVSGSSNDITVERFYMEPNIATDTYGGNSNTYLYIIKNAQGVWSIHHVYGTVKSANRAASLGFSTLSNGQNTGLPISSFFNTSKSISIPLHTTYSAAVWHSFTVTIGTDGTITGSYNINNSQSSYFSTVFYVM